MTNEVVEVELSVLGAIVGGAAVVDECLAAYAAHAAANLEQTSGSAEHTITPGSNWQHSTDYPPKWAK